VPAGLVRILDRDLKAAGILKRDERLLDVRGAVEKLPSLPLSNSPNTTAGEVRMTGTADRPESRPGLVAPAVAPTRCNRSHFGSTEVTEGSANESQNDAR
jgi:hypothetical protein